MTDKTFTVAGSSRLNGAVKARFANDLAGRVKVLDRCGHTDIKLVELPVPMTKALAAAHLLTIGFDAGSTEIRQALQHEVDRAKPKNKAAKTETAAAPEEAAPETSEQTEEAAPETAEEAPKPKRNKKVVEEQTAAPVETPVEEAAPAA